MPLLQPKCYDHLLHGTAFSTAQLQAHFTLYAGYVKKLNEILARLGDADRASANYAFGEYSELKRREPVAYNGTVLHELYFDALGRKGQTCPDGVVKQQITQSYGTWDHWVTDMKAAASSGHGWVLTVFDPVEKRLKTNLVQSEHHVGLFANTPILIALDVWEHAYTIQFGIKKADYLAAFFDSLDWGVIRQRFLRLAHAAPTGRQCKQ